LCFPPPIWQVRPFESISTCHKTSYKSSSAIRDAACIRIGIEFIEEDAKFPFGKILKSNTARALRRAELTEGQKQRIRRRVFGLLRDGHIPHEFREYAKLVRKIGYHTSEIPTCDVKNQFVGRFRRYFELAARAAGQAPDQQKRRADGI
jgi:hypothetical protein